MLDFQIPRITSESVEQNRGTFTIEPLDRGFGYTFGNSLRRVLLSSLAGAAVTSVRIEGVAHEFSTVQGVKEDVTDIVLNLKGIVCRMHSDASEVEAPLIPIRDKSRERLRRTIEHFHRIWPKRKMGIRRHNVDHSFLLYERDNVIRKDSVAISREGCRCGRLSCSFCPDEGNTATFESHCAGMQTGNATQPQEKSEDRSQKIGSSVFERQCARPHCPECLSISIQPELRAIGISDAQKCTLCNLPNPQTRLASFS